MTTTGAASDSAAAAPASPETVEGAQKLCRAKDPAGAPCVKPRAHPYSDTGGPKKAHRTAENVFFHGGVNTPAQFYMGAGESGHLSEADHQTWMRL